MALDIVTGELIGAVVGSVLYGVFLLLCVISARLVCTQGQRTNKIILYTLCLLFGLITANWVIELVRLYIAFVKKGNQPFGPLLYIIDISQPLEVARVATYALITVLMNFLLVWRLYVIWGRSICIVCFPILGCLGQSAAMCVQLWYLSHSTIANVSVGSNVYTWTTVFYSLEFCVSIICSALIVWKLVQNSRRLAQAGLQDFLVPIIQLIVESALLYSALSAVLLALFVTYRTGETLLMLGLVPPTIGINYALLVVVIHTHASRSSSSSSRSAPRATRNGRSAQLRVEVSRQTVSDGEQSGFSVRLDNVESARRASDKAAWAAALDEAAAGKV